VLALLFNAGVQVPVMPLFDVVGNGNNAPPAQMAGTWVKLGVVLGFTKMVIVPANAHCPPLGEKVYVVVKVLFKAGVQVPVMPLFDVVGNGNNAPPAQMAGTWVKLGVVFGFTKMVIVPADAHCPPLGEKVYVVVKVLFKAGVQVPVMPLFDVVGNGNKVSPAQIPGTCVKLGMVMGFTTMVKVVVVPH